MKTRVDSIAKHPELTAASDFYGLRRQGVGLIEQLASASWTDYNSHDPGITILEALCYAITDLSYRSQWPIADLLTLPNHFAGEAYPDQAFFSAREILTVNPTSEADWRRLLIDLDQVRNAWVESEPCACDFGYSAWCDAQQLKLAYQTDAVAETIKVKGLYDVMVELESDAELGDLNARSVQAAFNVFDGDGKAHAVQLELRYPQLTGLPLAEQTLLLAAANGNPALQSVVVQRLADNKSYNLLSDASKTTADGDAYLRSRWNQVLYLDLHLSFTGGQSVDLKQTALRLFSDNYAKQNGSLAGLLTQLQQTGSQALLTRLLRKLRAGERTLDAVKAALHRHRNLDEDFRRVKIVEIEDIAACADIEVRADADIELIQAQIWLTLEQFCSPSLRFENLNALLEGGMAVESIFNGPALNNGFIDDAQLAAAQLPSVLRTSDLLNRLMDIDGLVSVNNLLLSKYDRDGQVVGNAAQTGNDTLSASWQIAISPLHQPRFHRQLSRFLFYKHGLPLMARADEALATLQTLRGQQQRPKIRSQSTNGDDLPAPRGEYREVQAYWPLQYALPPVYGIGPEGLPAHADNLRRAQAKQLKGYLMVFEQIVANAQAQIDHCRALFSLNPDVKRSYFVQLLSNNQLDGYSELVAGLSQQQLEQISESANGFVQRRNRFLDHLLARFGESFNEYALLMSRGDGWLSGEERLIEDKLSFLQNYPAISHDRYRSFDLKALAVEGNAAGLLQRIALQLGFPNLRFVWEIGATSPYTVAYRLNDGYRDWFSGQLPQTIAAASKAEAQRQAYKLLLPAFGKSSRYRIEGSGASQRLRLNNDSGQKLGQSEASASASQLLALQSDLIGWSSQARAIVIEHLLLRPKFPGDALFPACSEPCSPCDADPYSFRLTWAMPGWMPPYNTDLELRDFADRSIRRETPSHLLAKVCWLANDGFDDDTALIDNLQNWLRANVKTASSQALTREQAALAADRLYRHLLQHFMTWYEQHRYQFYADDLLKAALTTLLDALPTSVDLGAAALTASDWTAVRQDFVGYCRHLVRHGWRFERFQQAWRQWLEVNRQFDWQGMSVAEEVQMLLKSRLLNGSAERISSLSQRLLNAYGQRFYQWMQGKFQNRVIPQPWHDADFADFTPLALVLSDYDAELSFVAGTQTVLQTLLDRRYNGLPGQSSQAGYQGFREVSYALQQLLNLLADINSTYPPATLHDCDDGSDQNPVRLNQTILGSLANDSDSSLTL